MSREITHGNLFSGSGTWELAAKLFGIKTLWEAEIEPFPVALEAKRFPEAIQLGDVSKINGAEIPPVDIFTNSSPCQGLSIAGQRKGLNDDRSTLFSEAIRICKEMREADVKRQLHSGWSDVNVRPVPRYPSYFCWENVPGALSSHGGDPHIEPGADFKAVLESIVEIVQEERPDISIPVGGWHNSGILDGDNFQIAWRVIDAQYELPQRRRRVFVIASLRDRSAGEVLFEREGLPWDFKAVAESWESPSRSLEDRIDTASRIIDGTVRRDEEGMGEGVIRKNG